MIVIPFGGISNRLKCIISAIAEYGDITLRWDVPNSGGGVRCQFSDLFTNTFNSTSNRTISDCKFIHDYMNTHNPTDNNKEDVDIEMQKKYIDIINDLNPVQYVQDEVKRLHNELPSDYTTVSVRTFRSFPQEYKSWGQYFDINLLFTELDTIDSSFLLTCDDTDTLHLIKGRYGDKVITTPKRTKFGDFQSVVGMQDILIDLILGGMAKKIYGTGLSSFSEMQWWMGKCTAKYKQMKLHVK